MSNDRYMPIKVLVCALVAVCLFLLAYAALSVPLGDGKRLGLRGLKRRRALEKNDLWPSIEPLVRWIGMRVSALGLIPPKVRADLDRKVSIAGDFMGLLPEEVIGFSIVTALFGAVAGSFLGYISGVGNVLIVACFILGAAAPYMTITSTGEDRMKELNRRLPYGIDLLALAMGAGLDFPGAVKQVIEKSGTPDDPLVEEFTLILQGLQLGRTRRQALEDFAERAPSESIKEFVGAVVQAELRGNPVANVLRIQAEVSRQRRSVRAEEAASKAAVQMVGPLMLVFLAILLLVVSPMVLAVSQSGM
ncbi:MAG: type II secretion system F family protein [Polyangiaceae bacterium]|nr:type II secretion system F family protein [Polyangiaceae bacterium]